MIPPRNFCGDFSPFDGHIWLNAASEGPLPRVSSQALADASVWKSKPYLLDTSKFVRAIVDLKETIATLICVNSKEVILGNSASYGIHLLANGIRWRKNDEIVLMQNDFPTDVVPWLGLVHKGVKVIQVKPKGRVMAADELDRAITKRTKVFCMTHVHTFSGHTIDVSGCVKVCRQRNVAFVLNISQSAGSMPVDVGAMGVDAIVCAGYKWLLGPYGTGFTWIRPELRDKLDLNLSYWIARFGEEELHKEDKIVFKDIKGARKYDVFATANFFNFIPFNASLRYLLEIGLDQVYRHNQTLIDVFIENLNKNKFDFISPLDPSGRSCLAVITHKTKLKNKFIHQDLAAKNIHTALWKGNIRISPHIYNTEEDIRKLMACLNDV